MVQPPERTWVGRLRFDDGKEALKSFELDQTISMRPSASRSSPLPVRVRDPIVVRLPVGVGKAGTKQVGTIDLKTRPTTAAFHEANRKRREGR